MTSIGGGIYVLIDPRTQRVRYVGQTTSFKRRASDYACRLPGRRPLVQWHNKILSLGLRTIFVPVVACGLDTINAFECAWIATLKLMGCALLNIDQGGVLSRAGMLGKTHTAKTRATLAERTRSRWSESGYRERLAISISRGRLGIRPSEATRARMRGRKPWNKGKPASAKVRAAVSAANLGRKQSAETIAKRSAKMVGHAVSAATRDKIRAANVGRSPTPEARAKISASLSGRPSPRRGIPFTDEHKAKLSAAHAGVPLTEEHRRNIGVANLGRVISDFTRSRAAESNRARVWTPEMRAKSSATKLALKRTMTPEERERHGAARRGKKLGPHSEETKRKLSAALKGRRLPGRPRSAPRMRINLIGAA